MLYITDYFQAIKAGQDITKLLPKADTREYYFYIKAYKLVDEQGFYAYCRVHNQNPTFLAMLNQILLDHYPPLEYNHEAKDGYKGLSNYIHYCKQVFNA